MWHCPLCCYNSTSILKRKSCQNVPNSQQYNCLTITKHACGNVVSALCNPQRYHLICCTEESRNKDKTRLWMKCVHCCCSSIIVPSFAKRGFCFGSAGLFVCLSVCKQHYSKSYEWIAIKKIWRGPGWYSEELIDFWWWSGSSTMSKCKE